MTREDINGLFELLRIYFPNSSKPKNETLKSAWLLVLEPYDRETVRAALAEQLRESKFFPDPQSIASKCPPVQRAEMGAKQEILPDLAGWNKQLATLKRHEALVELRQSAGLPPTWEAAQAAGLKAVEWTELLDGQGLGVEVVL